MAATSDQEYDRANEMKQFDHSKIEVRGIVDSAITTTLPFLVHPPETVAGPDLILVIDFTGVNTDHGRAVIVDQIRRAASTVGLFQIVNHGAALGVLDRTLAFVKGFHEQTTEKKARYYSREGGTGVYYFSNIDLVLDKAATWRETIQITLRPKLADHHQIPEICRNEVAEFDTEIKRVGVLLSELLSEGLGVDSKRLENMTCLEDTMMEAHYSPFCPQPNLTNWPSYHTDQRVFTVLQQDHVGGLQVCYRGSWVDVNPVPGALAVKVGEFLQVISNDKYNSPVFRVLAKPNTEPRVSIAVSFNPGNKDELYEPLLELVSARHIYCLIEFGLLAYFISSCNIGFINEHKLN